MCGGARKDLASFHCGEKGGSGTNFPGGSGQNLKVLFAVIQYGGCCAGIGSAGENDDREQEFCVRR